MTPEDWDSGFGKSIAVFLNGEAYPNPTPRGYRVVDDSFLLCFNGHDADLDFVVPRGSTAPSGIVHLDTAVPQGNTDLVVRAGEKITARGPLGDGPAQSGVTRHAVVVHLPAADARPGRAGNRSPSTTPRTCSTTSTISASPTCTCRQS